MPVVKTTNATEAGYEAVRHGGVGLINLSSRGRIRVEGSEAVMFLNGLVTNDMKTLEQDHWMPAVFPNVQGRLIAAVRIIRLATRNDKNRAFILDTESSTHHAVLKTIERFTLAGDFRVTDITAETVTLSLQGQPSRSLLKQALGDSADQLTRDGVSEMQFNGTSLTVLRTTHTSEDGYDLILEGAQGPVLSQTFINAGAIPISDEAFETLRIEAGIGRFGVDMDETNVVTEANLDDAVSFTKGCYIGQEIIARIKYRGHVAKKLTGLVFCDDQKPDANAVVKNVDGKEVGRVTSATFSPQLHTAIALGYVRFEYLSPGTDVLVGEQNLKAKVTELPLIRGTWYEATVSQK